MKISIVIPYFQDRQGILKRTLSSIIGQSLDDNVKVDIIIIDDASPVSG